MGLDHKSFLHKLPNDRFEVHELLRQFAQEYLARTGESHAIQRRHADYFRALAEPAESLLYSTEQRRWVERLESDHDNLQAALAWTLTHQELECLVRLASALSHFWDCRGYYVELNQWLEQAVTLAEHAWGHLADRSTGELEPALRRRLELLAKVLSTWADALMHDRQQAEALYWRSVVIEQQIGPTLTTFKSYIALAWIERRRGNFLRADELQRAALQLAQTLPGLQDQERQRTIAFALVNQGVNAFFQADLQRCETLVQQALPLADQEKDRRNLIHANGLLGLIAMYGGDFARASTLLTNCYAEFTAAGDTDGVIYVRCHLGLLALRRDDWRTAQLAFVENLSWLQRHHRDYDAWVHNLRGLVEVLRRQQQYVLAAQLLGALEMIRERIKYVIAPVFQPDFEATMTGTRSQLDPATFSAAYREGYGMSPEQALAFALANMD
jgi:non-specific serine/threonine protein kinase